MSLFTLAIVIIATVIIVAPICIYFILKYSNLDAYRKRFKKANPYIFHRDNSDDDA